MTIHTDTFPATVAFAAGSPQFGLDIHLLNGKALVFLYRLDTELTTEIRLEVTKLFTEVQLRSLASKGPRREKVNLIDNKSFKHLLERLETKNIIAL